MTLTLHPEPLAVCRLAAEVPVPAWVVGDFTSVTRTPEELSIVCPQRQVPDGIPHRGGWQALAVAGPLDFALTGVLASLAAPLADAGISIFVIATFDTDWLLVQAADLKRTVQTLRSVGHHIQDH